MPDPAQDSNPQLALIAALSSNGVIGRDNTMPWHLPADLKHFKRVTLGKPILMGRKTYESIGRPLPGRENIVISTNPGLEIAGCHTCTSLDTALTLAHKLNPQGRSMVIGGGQLYRLAMPLADRMYLTRVHAEIEGDTFFPEIEPNEWREVQREDFKADSQSQWDLSFIDYQRLPISGHPD